MLSVYRFRFRTDRQAGELWHYPKALKLFLLKRSGVFARPARGDRPRRVSLCRRLSKSGPQLAPAARRSKFKDTHQQTRSHREQPVEAPHPGAPAPWRSVGAVQSTLQSRQSPLFPSIPDISRRLVGPAVKLQHTTGSPSLGGMLVHSVLAATAESTQARCPEPRRPELRAGKK